MLFITPSFIFLFLPIVLCLAWFLKERYLIPTILIASIFFYWLGNGLLILLIFYIGLILYFQIKKQYLADGVTIALILFPLFWFKYAQFLIDSFSTIVEIDIPTYSGELPLGISFFTFQSIAYYVDTKREGKNYLNTFSEVMLFLTFFPQLVAGPILKSKNFKSDLSKTSRYEKNEILSGILRISNGLIKKLIFADSLSRLVDININTFQMNMSSLAAWIIVLAFTFQIYFDFSGYCDIAVGIGKLLGFNLPENFNFPYQASSFSEFWKRWHITLSSFFRDYVYIPLGGNRNGTLITYRNLWITFFLTALWHGANYTFLLWGAIHGFFLSIEKLTSKSRTYKSFIKNRFVTFFLVSISWIPFRFSNLESVKAIFQSLFSFNTINDKAIALLASEFNLLTLIAFTAGFLSIVVNADLLSKIKNQVIQKELIYFSYILFIFLTAILSVFMSDYYPFIYFRF